MLFKRLILGFSRRKLILHDPKQIQQIHKRAPQLPSISKAEPERCFTASLIGLPNCGKSTLFNVLAGERLALTDSIPGMTRDRKQIKILNGLLRLIDTAGVQTECTRPSPQTPKKQLKQDMLSQTLSAYAQSDLILLVVDVKKGITTEQLNFVEYLRKQGKKKIILVANKCEGMEEYQVLPDLVKMGIPEIFYISAEQGDGVLELLQRIDQEIPNQVREGIHDKRNRRKQRFASIIKEMRDQIEGLGEAVDTRQWEKEFLRLNPNPQDNSELDEDTPNKEAFTKPQQSFSTVRGTSSNNPHFKKTIQLCIVGRPNVGKSSLINQLLGYNKLLVNEQSHTTRDSTTTEWMFKDRKMRLVDTAGLSSTNFDKNPEHLKKVQVATMNHVKFSHVVVYLLDALSAMKQEDFVFVRRVLMEGRAVVLAVNKWEVIKSEYKRKAVKYMEKQIQTHLGEMNQPKIAFFSAKTQEGIDELMQQVLDTYDRWNRRISTGMLNDWLKKFKKLDNLPTDSGNQLKIRYVVQAKSRPPTFILFVNNKELFKANYLRFLRSNLVQEFNLKGVAVRVVLKNIVSSGNQATKKAIKNPVARQRKQFMKKIKRQEKLADLKSKFGDFGVKKKESSEPKK